MDTPVCERYWHIRVNPVEGHKDGQWLDYLTFELNLREQGLFSLKSKQEEILTVNYLMGGYREERPRLFSEVHSERMRGKKTGCNERKHS